MFLSFQTAVENTAQSIDDRNCLPFIGAGVSAWEDWPYPSVEEWERMADFILGCSRPLDPRDAVSHAQAAARNVFSKPLDASQSVGAPPTWFVRLTLLTLLRKDLAPGFANAELGTLATQIYTDQPKQLANLLSNWFADGRSCPRVNELHRILSLFPFERIITTNYDGLIESAHQAIGAGLEVAADDDECLNTGHIRPQLFKLHGDFGLVKRPKLNKPHLARRFLNSIILTDPQYWNFPGRPGLGSGDDAKSQGSERTVMVERIRSMMLTHQVVFLGYGLNDFNVMELFHSMSGFEHKKERPLLITPEKASVQQFRVWISRGFDVVSCDLKQFVKAVWERLYGNLDLASLASGNPSRLSGDARLDIPILILNMHAGANPSFQDKLRQIAEHCYFPEALLAGEPKEFMDRLKAFVDAGWLRRIDVSHRSTNETTIFYQFVAEIRQRLRYKLNTSKIYN